MIIKKIQRLIGKLFSFRLRQRQSLYMHRSEILRYTKPINMMGVTSKTIADREVVVSLTTYGKRIYDVYLTIESIMRGSMQPNRIVLWLQEEYQHMTLPQTLLNQVDRGLEIKYTKDIRSYKKLVPSLKEYPESIIITIDDDVLYDIDVVEKLVNAYINDPTKVYANVVRQIEKSKDSFKPYLTWKHISYGTEDSKYNIAIGVGGVLYPPHCMPEIVFKDEIFMELAPKADDLWFWCMERLNNVVVSKVYTHKKNGGDFVENYDNQEPGLMESNVGNCKNDIQFTNLINYFSEQQIF